MRKDDLFLLREVQKRAGLLEKEMEQLGIQAQKDLSLDLSKELLQASAIYDHAVTGLMEKNEQPGHIRGMDEKRQKRRIARNILLNTSRSHLAHLLIKDQLANLGDMWAVMKKHENASLETMEIAREFVDFEEELIERMRKYL